MPDKKAPKPKVFKFDSIDDADTSKMSFEQLQSFCVRVFEETTKEKQEAEQYELERDKLVIYWSYTGDKLRDALYDLRDQQLCLENDEFAMNTRLTRKIEEGRRHIADASATVEDELTTRGAALEKQHEIILDKNHQIWTDAFQLRSKIFDVEILKSEALTDQKYVEQNHLELITKNLVKQRKMDIKRLKKEMSKSRKNYLNATSEKFRRESWLKRETMKQVIEKNHCDLKNLVSHFKRIVNYNFEKVSVLKDKAERLKKLDIMLSQEYSEKSKEFFKAVSFQAQNMKTLNQMKTFLFAAGKTEKSLRLKNKELKSNKLESECLSVKSLNKEWGNEILEERVKELTRIIILYRRLMTEMIREDEEILNGEIDQLLIKLYDHKVRLYALIEPDKNVNLEYETADLGDLTYKTQNIGSFQSKLHDFKLASSAVVTLFNRLFKIWDINYENLGIIHKEVNIKSVKNRCEALANYYKW